MQPDTFFEGNRWGGRWGIAPSGAKASSLREIPGCSPWLPALWLFAALLLPGLGPTFAQAPAGAVNGAITGGAAGPAIPCGGGLVESVQREYQAIESFEARFRQEDLRGDGLKILATGRVAYRRPGRMRWEYDPPNEQLLVTDGKTIWLFDPLLDNVTVHPLEDLTRGTPLAFLLGAGSLSEDFRCEPFSIPPPRDGLDYLELHPRTPIPGLAFIQLGVAKKGQGIQVLRLVDSQGNVRQVRFEGLRTGVTFPPRHFEFEIEEGMEVISK